MKRLLVFRINPAIFEELSVFWTQLRRHKTQAFLFLIPCFNLILAPVVLAASGNEFSRSQAYALGILGLVTIALSLYLFVVMFAPERF